MSQSDNRAASERTTTPAPTAVARPAATAASGASVPSAPASRPAPVTPVAPRPSGPRSPAEIEREIEATRARLAGAIDDLADRVSPKNVAKRGADKAKLTVIDESGAPRTGRLAAVGAAVVALAGIVLWRRRG